jgi:hypothetical protein
LFDFVEHNFRVSIRAKDWRMGAKEIHSIRDRSDFWESQGEKKKIGPNNSHIELLGAV